jgi:ribonuclease VapC
MVLDTSAVLAILQNEPERASFSEAIEAAETRSMSAASLLECSMIIESRFGADGVRDLDFLLAKAHIVIEPVDEDQARVARQGFRRFGKGRHPAGLDFGDCFSYALSRSRAAPLLFKGRDFSLSDVECHPASAST